MTLLSFRQAAQVLGCSRETVSDLVRCYGLVPKYLPKRGKGLDESDLRKLRQLLNPALQQS